MTQEPNEKNPHGSPKNIPQPSRTEISRIHDQLLEEERYHDQGEEIVLRKKQTT